MEPFLILGQDSASHYIYGATNATEKFQEALDQFIGVGGALYVKAGPLPCDIFSSLLIDSNVQVIFSPGVLMRYGAGSAYNAMFRNRDQVNGNTNISLVGPRIDGNKANATGNDPRDMIRYLNVTDSKITGARIFNFPDSAIVIDGEGSMDNLVDDYVIDTGDDIGIYFSNTGRNKIGRGTVRNIRSYGIRIRRTTVSGLLNEIVGATVVNCGVNPDPSLNVAGIMVDTCDLTKVVGCTSIGSGTHNFYIKSSYCTVNDNTSYNANQHGFFVKGAQRGTLNSNVNHNASRQSTNIYSGIYLEDAADLAVNGNRSGDSGNGPIRQKYGLEEAGTSNNNKGTGNVFDRNGTGAKLTVGAGTVIT